MSNDVFQNKLKEQRQPVVDQILESLEKGELPWDKPWISDVPYNAKTNKAYKGINRFILMLNAHAYGYTDPRWMTFNQAKEAGYSVKKKPENWEGAYGVRIECWKLYNRETKKVMNFSEYISLPQDERMELDKVLVLRNYPATVFNAENIEGIEPLKYRNKIAIKKNVYEKIVNAMLENMNLVMNTGRTAQAFYAHDDDMIYLPDAESFKSTEGYYSTLFHEFAHATGHVSRLNRLDMNRFDDQARAKEELVAEITSMFFGQEVHLPAPIEAIENHQAYIQSWISVLKDDPNELFRAIKTADSVSDYMVEKGNVEKIMHSQKNRTFEQILKEIDNDIAPNQPLKCIRVTI